MGYKCSFLDNETYGADDVSAAFSRLTTAGVLAYPERDTVAQSLDALTAEVVSSGVGEFGGLEVSVTDDGVIIGEGAAFFESGVSIEVDSEGILLETTVAETTYVALRYEEEFNRVVPVLSAEEPEGDVVILAKIDADGTIYDMRSYASSKVAPNTANVYHDFSLYIERFGKAEGVNRNTAEYIMPHTGFRYLMLRSVDCGTLLTLPVYNIIDLSLEEDQRIQLTQSSSPAYLYIRREGTKLIFYAIRTNDFIEQNYTFTLA